MSSSDPTLDFLESSVLSSSEHLATHYRNISRSVIESEVQKFRNLAAERSEPESSELAVYIADRGLDQPTARQLLYSDVVYADDPLSCFAPGPRPLPPILGRDFDGPPPLKLIAEAVKAILECREAIRDGVVRLMPVSPQPETIDLPLLTSENNFYDLLPPATLKEYRDRSIIRTVIEANGRALVATELRRCNHISIGFRGEPLHATGFTLDYSENGTIRPQPLADVTEDKFRRWVDGCTNRAAWMMFGRLMSAIAIADRFGLRYAAASELDGAVLVGSMSFRKDDFVCSALPELKLPAIDNMSVSDVLRLRRDAGDSIAELRAKLRKDLARLRSISDPAEREATIREASDSLADDIRRVHRDVRTYRKLTALGASSAFATICLSVAWTPAVLLGGLITVAPVLASAFERKMKVNSSPGFVFLKMNRSRKGRSR